MYREYLRLDGFYWLAFSLDLIAVRFVFGLFVVYRQRFRTHVVAKLSKKWIKRTYREFEVSMCGSKEHFAAVYQPAEHKVYMSISPDFDPILVIVAS